MDWSLIIFVVVVLFFGYRGYRKGLLRSLSRVLSLLAGYVAAILYATHVSSLLESKFQPARHRRFNRRIAFTVFPGRNRGKHPVLDDRKTYPGKGNNILCIFLRRGHRWINCRPGGSNCHCLDAGVSYAVCRPQQITMRLPARQSVI